MAADVKAPRIVRETTNMQDAAAAMRARCAPRSSFHHVDPDLIDNALADLEVADTFLDAAERYWDEVNEWVKPQGFGPNRALHQEVGRGLLIMQEGGDRIGVARERLRTVLDQAMSLRRRAIDGRPFAEAMDRYRNAYLEGQGYYLLNIGKDRRWSQKHQDRFDAIVVTTYSYAVDVLTTPASSAADIALKQIVIEQQRAFEWGGNTVAAYTRQLVADALAFAGGAA